ncbi:L-ascorbate metabolism protein UlaG, beta-lactamase superfamily [Polaribacter sp. KT25b]|uniref:MBL fold metallo-hydrolase n=1 Tax=Polaribacter sp. KT25b TaxID=1855336 RepID=UPI00087A3856|nr:MBL fold metallo-hydrolase [Polaribacter sp. KT25b]SDR96716.1 L-ascorbate metabolism protein UlaG, beta-lactamase superfamily [Polaribacter sp. KT25b]
MLVSLVVLVVVLIVIYFLFVGFYPSFGGDISKEKQTEFMKSPQFHNRKFENTHPVNMDMSFSETLTMAKKFFFTKVEDGRPKNDIVVQKIDATNIANYASSTRFVWFGHSSFLLQMNHKNILIDPMFSDVPAPHSLLGGKRFSAELPIEVQKLPKIDAVILSHDHYDHLDYESILKLKDKVGIFYAPLGVGVHLEAWGVSTENIIELDWWQETTLADLKFVCTPAKHFSGRKFSNRQSTLWSSWVIQSATENIFFSGDSGYDSHFSAIGKKYGPFDFAMMECGQYNEMWPEIHMFPEETAQAAVDVKAKKMMPIHWGAFKLAMHSWKDPAERVTKKAKELNLPLITPKIGEAFLLKAEVVHNQDWWK